MEDVVPRAKTSASMSLPVSFDLHNIDCVAVLYDISVHANHLHSARG
jgi:hypothetical protein